MSRPHYVAQAPHSSGPSDPFGLRASAAAGVLGAWGLILGEFIFLAVQQRARLSGLWELRSGLAGLGPAWILIAVFPGIVGGWCARALGRANPSEYRRTTWSVGGAGFLFGASVGWGLGGGRHLATLAARGGFALALACSLALLAWFLASRVIVALARFESGFGPKLFGTLAIIAAFGLESANTLLLVRLYPVFHLALSALSLALAGGALVFLRARTPLRDDGPAVSGFYSHRRPSSFRPIVYGAGSVTALACVLLVPSSRAVAGFDNFRWMVQEGPPTLAWGVEIASTIAPPAPLDPALSVTPLGTRRQGGAMDLRDRDILLISIDALRADHVGAYGYKRPTTPAMDRLAREGILFEAAYAATPHTSYSVTSLMTGKYMRPLLLQGAGGDSRTWASLMRSYGYRTAAFYPPAIFYIDTPRFESFRSSNLDFEYAKVEFAEGDIRVNQVKSYLNKSPKDHHIFLWVHLFGPHEPYEKQSKYDFGPRDVDLYDGEIAAADETVGRIIALARKRDPRCIVMLTADHGEEFGEHGGRYHGSSVYDEQVRVPLIISGKGLRTATTVSEPVQTIDLLPTLLDGLQIPIPPRVRGRSLVPLIQESPETKSSEEETAAAPKASSTGHAWSETHDYTLLAKGKYRLICQRRSGACQLYDIEKDPSQRHDVSKQEAAVVKRMRSSARLLAETHGKYESEGLRAEGKGWPPVILLGISGDASVAPSLAALLDDADTSIRRKAAELLFSLGTKAQTPALRLALTREEDKLARSWLALALTSLGEGAPLVQELLQSPNQEMSRLAALALAEQGDDSGEKVLIEWWLHSEELEFEMARRLLKAFARLGSAKLAPYLVASLKNERLRPLVAATLAKIGDEDSRVHLAASLRKERYHSSRLPLAQAILDLGGEEELIAPLRHFLGVPDGLEGGLALARKADILEDLGGPNEQDRQRLHQLSDSGVALKLVVPPAPKSSEGVRLVIRCRSRSGKGGSILVQPGLPRAPLKKGATRARHQPNISPETALKLAVPNQVQKGESNHKSELFHEIRADLPADFHARSGHHLFLEIFAPQDIEIVDIAALPLRRDLPPPAPQEWKGTSDKRIER